MVRGILGSLDQDAVGRAGPGTELAADAALQAVVVALQHVPTPEAGIPLPLLLRILDRHRPGEHGLERKRHALDERADAGNAIADGTHHFPPNRLQLRRDSTCGERSVRALRCQTCLPTAVGVLTMRPQLQVSMSINNCPP